MTQSIRLPVVQPEALERRKVLLLGATAVGVAACGAPTTMGSDSGSGSDTAAGGNDSASADTAPSDDSNPTPDAPACTAGPTMVGMVTDFPADTWTLLVAPNMIIGHDSGGMYAYSSVCTHQQCIVNQPDSSGDAFCQCHGSRFDNNGAVINGPARRPLTHFALTVCEDVVYVDGATSVPATTRTPV